MVTCLPQVGGHAGLGELVSQPAACALTSCPWTEPHPCQAYAGHLASGPFWSLLCFCDVPQTPGKESRAELKESVTVSWAEGG